MAINLNTTFVQPLLVSQWKSDDTKVGVSLEVKEEKKPDEGVVRKEFLKYAVQDGARRREGQIENTYYSTDYAIQLINLFRKVFWPIGARSPHLLPYVFMDVATHKNGSLTPTSDLLVGLFGEYRSSLDFPEGRLCAEWSIYNRQSRKIVWIKANPNWGCVKEFFIGTSSNKNPFYLRYFRPIVVLDPNNNIQSIELKRSSLMNRDVCLTPDSWAVTLISDPMETGPGCNVGHALIACEGVEEDGRHFFDYIHLVQVRVKIQNKETKKVFIRRHNIEKNKNPEEFIAKVRRGPTWIRPKGTVKPMFDFAKQVENKEVRFNRLAPLFNWFFKSTVATTVDYLDGTLYQNCIAAAVYILRKGNIWLPEPKRPEPNVYLDGLDSDYIIEDEDEDDSIRAMPKDPAKRLQVLIERVIVTGTAFIKEKEL